jgi:hypothetical protein
MKGLTKLLGIIATAAVIAVGMAGCGGEEDIDDTPGVDLLPITGETTGRPRITGTDITLEAEQNITQAEVYNLNLAGETDQGGKTWSVEGGKLTFSLKTPDETDTLDAEMSSLGPWTNVQIDPADARAFSVTEFSAWGDDNKNYYTIKRHKSESEENIYNRYSEIIYLYVSKGVTVSGESEQDDYGVTYTAFDISLKTGWNLLQWDAFRTQTGGTQILSIAEKNVPWTVTRW